MTETLFFGFVFLCLVPLYQNVKKNMFFTPDTVFVFAFLLYRCTLPINFLFFGNDYDFSLKVETLRIHWRFVVRCSFRVQMIRGTFPVPRCGISA